MSLDFFTLCFFLAFLAGFLAFLFVFALNKYFKELFPKKKESEQKNVQKLHDRFDALEQKVLKQQENINQLFLSRGIKK